MIFYVANFVTALHSIFGQKVWKLRGPVKDAFLNENENEKHQNA